MDEEEEALIDVSTVKALVSEGNDPWSRGLRGGFHGGTSLPADEAHSPKRQQFNGDVSII